MINWSAVTKEDMEKIHKIGRRACEKASMDLMSLEMDITAVYLLKPLSLDRFLVADEFNFYHDIYGIISNVDRNTGALDNCFVPRFTTR